MRQISIYLFVVALALPSTVWAQDTEDPNTLSLDDINLDDIEEIEEADFEQVDASSKFYSEAYPVAERGLNLLTGRAPRCL